LQKKPLTIPPLLVVGASTGGPAALVKLFSSFSPSFDMACIVIQHINQEFASSLAYWLGNEVEIPVGLVEEGYRPEKGKILIAGRNEHLRLNNECQFVYSALPLENPYSPSVDVFFESVADNWPQSSIAVLLTGMGNDGAQGLKALHDKGWFTITQNQESCIVYGMPKIAEELGASDYISPPEKMHAAIREHLKRNTHE
jgi:two-component system response regulator WspF